MSEKRLGLINTLNTQIKSVGRPYHIELDPTGRLVAGEDCKQHRVPRPNHARCRYNLEQIGLVRLWCVIIDNCETSAGSRVSVVERGYPVERQEMIRRALILYLLTKYTALSFCVCSICQNKAIRT